MRKGIIYIKNEKLNSRKTEKAISSTINARDNLCWMNCSVKDFRCSWSIMRQLKSLVDRNLRLFRSKIMKLDVLIFAVYLDLNAICTTDMLS